MKTENPGCVARIVYTWIFLDFLNTLSQALIIAKVKLLWTISTKSSRNGLIPYSTTILKANIATGISKSLLTILYWAMLLIHGTLNQSYALYLKKVWLYQLSMALENFFIRGAITVGDLFLDENTVFGQTLLEAYELESRSMLAIRELFSQEDVVKYLRRHIGFYGNPRHAPQTREVLLDADGEIFVHYLYLLIDQASYNPYLNAEDLANHKEIVIRNIENISKYTEDYGKNINGLQIITTFFAISAAATKTITMIS